jgi:hypothetical protein
VAFSWVVLRAVAAVIGVGFAQVIEGVVFAGEIEVPLMIVTVDWLALATSETPSPSKSPTARP